MNDVFVRLIPLPVGCRGMTVTDADGNYNIYINQNLAANIQQQAYFHEMSHVIHGDLHSYEHIDKCEQRAILSERRAMQDAVKISKENYS